MLDALGLMQAEAERDRLPRRRSAPSCCTTALDGGGLYGPGVREDYELLPVQGEVPVGAELAVRIAGDSMEPYIRTESVVYVNHDPLRSGDVGIFCVDGDMLCKQYYQGPPWVPCTFFPEPPPQRCRPGVHCRRQSVTSPASGRVMLHTPPLPYDDKNGDVACLGATSP